jgi:probable phosphoglycerate mutase
MGRQPIGLSDAGRAQSRALVPLLRTLAPDRVLTSPLARARETAEIIATALRLPLALEPDLVELDFGAWEGRSYDDLVVDPAYLAFSREPGVASPPGGESVGAAQARALAAVGRALASTPHGRVCVVSHGDILRLVLVAALRLEVRELRRLRIDTCGVSAIELTGDWAEVKFLNLLADPDRVWAPLHWGR